MDESKGSAWLLLCCLQPRALEMKKRLHNEHRDVMKFVREDLSRGVVVTIRDGCTCVQRTH